MPKTPSKKSGKKSAKAAVEQEEEEVEEEDTLWHTSNPFLKNKWLSKRNILR
jgi:hypothetical protein